MTTEDFKDFKQLIVELERQCIELGQYMQMGNGRSVTVPLQSDIIVTCNKILDAFMDQAKVSGNLADR